MADDKKTTVPPQGRDTVPERVRGNGSITFYCTNGHRISVSSSLAGKRGTCSKCGIALRIPLPGPSAGPSEAAAPPADATVPASANEQPGGEKATAAGPDFSGLPAAEERPDSGESAAEAPPADEGTELQRLFEAVTDGKEGSNASVEAVESSVHAAVGRTVAEDAAEPNHQELSPNATAQLVARLWAERDHGGIVELHLTGGSVILPEWYEPAWSRGTHGLFASQAADGTVTLTAVAWESIQKVVVRQVEGLPDGMFE